ncbi:MAG: hypothetical protein K2Q22_16095 [Cytophagales bacterium]|nr:hypothetical protein [Cytophagales bacterium]
MEKIIKTKFDLISKAINFDKLEEAALWVVFLILPWVVLGYQAMKLLF